MMKTKSALSPSCIEALQLYAVAADGGDPNMSHISSWAVLTLEQLVLIRPHTDEEFKCGLLRHRVPTEAGYAELARLMTPKRSRSRVMA